MAKMQEKDLYIVDDYIDVMLNVRKVDKIAVLMVKDNIPCITIHDAKAFCIRVRRDWYKLLQNHDGIRLGKFELRNGSRNLEVFSLFKSAETVIPINSKAGDAEFERTVAKRLHGRRFGGMKHHPCDVLLQDGTRIECKGLTGAFHADYDENGKLISSVELKETFDAHIQHLLINWEYEE